MTTTPVSAPARRSTWHLSWVLACGTLIAGVVCHLLVGWGGGHPLLRTDTSGLLWIPVLALAPLAGIVAGMLGFAAVGSVVVCLWTRNWMGALVSLFGGMLIWYAALAIGQQVAPALGLG
jgi:hypothetical protein